MSIIKQGYLIVVFLSLWVAPSYATDFAKEKRWANQVSEFLVDGYSHWLSTDKGKFFSIYTPARTNYLNGAVILLHGRGLHPDCPQVIHPLRTRLPENGWATLSIQLPVLANESSDADYIPLFDDVAERVEAGLDFLAERNIEQVVLIGHSLGSSMASHYLSTHQDPRIKAFVGIGMAAMPQPKSQAVLDNVVALLQVKVPVLDIYGSESVEKIMKSVDRRAYVVYHIGNDKSRQVKLDGANHLFQDHEDVLLKSITAWMDGTLKSLHHDKHASGVGTQ